MFPPVWRRQVCWVGCQSQSGGARSRLEPLRMLSPWSDDRLRHTGHSHRSADAALPAELITHKHSIKQHPALTELQEQLRCYSVTCQSSSRLLTSVSRHHHSVGLPLAVPPIERAVSNSRSQHGQLDVSILVSFILHLLTEWLCHEFRFSSSTHLAAVWIVHTSIITSKSVPNTGLACLMDSCSRPGSELSLGTSVTRRPAFSYTSLSFLDPVEKSFHEELPWTHVNVIYMLLRVFCFPTNLQDICIAQWRRLWSPHKHFWCWCSYPQWSGPLWSVEVRETIRKNVCVCV